MHHHRNLSIEECPLQQSAKSCSKRPSSYKGPIRVVKLCVLGILLPSLLIAVPVYMRYHVYGHQLYPLAMSDMRLIDNKVSTTWCQRQLVKVNATFNAFLLDHAPKMSPELKPLTMVRHLTLEDDTKEYWGFYLLQGSSVTVSTCVRWPGASLIVIRGHRHLHECAYIGDDSSEELDELMEAIREKTYVPPSPKPQTPKKVNQPDLMRRHRVNVEFLQPLSENSTRNYTLQDQEDKDISDGTDPKIMKPLLDAIQEKVKKTNGGKEKLKKMSGEDHNMHVRRNSTIAKGEDTNFQIQAPHPRDPTSRETYNDIVKKLQMLGKKGERLLEEINRRFNTNASTSEAVNSTEIFIDMKGRHYSKPAVSFEDNIEDEDDTRRRRKRQIEKEERRKKRQIFLSGPADDLNSDDEDNDMAVEEGFNPDGIAEHRGTINETTLNDYSNSEFWSSFSSSEEALLNCAGLILNLPLTPHHKCSSGLSESEAEETYLANTITYKVPVNGYYFFVFNSENEVQPNYIRVQFHLQKTVYNVSSAVSTCMNSSKTCAVDLKFFSEQKLVLELPVKENQSFWNEEFIVESECEPRTAVYAICVIAVPVLVVLFAFS